MADKVYNFGAGPAMLPEPVMQKIQQEWLNFQGMGISIIEISHRTKEFVAVLEEAQALFRELTNLPDNYRILFVHGGARMQFSALPLNFAGRMPNWRQKRRNCFAIWKLSPVVRILIMIEFPN